MPAVTRAAAVRIPGDAEGALCDGGAQELPLFRQRNFSALWWGQLVSLTGERCAYLALLALLAEQTQGMSAPGSAWLLSLLANVMLAPVLLFAPWAGPWIDRRNLRHVVVACDVLRAVTVLLIPLLYRLNGAIAPVFALLFLLFTSGVFFLPAKSALTPLLVPEPQLLAANTWLTVAGIIAAGAGTLGGGWLVDHWGWPRVLELNAVTYIVSACAMFTIRHTPQRPAAAAAMPSAREYVNELREGWGLIRRSAPVAMALLSLGAAWWCGGFLHVDGILHLQLALRGSGVGRLGILFAVLAVGAAASAWFINTRRQRARAPVYLAIACVVAGAGLIVFAAARRMPEFMVAACVLGIAASPIILLGETLLQESTPLGLRARVFATRDFLMRATLLASVSAGAWGARSWGPRTALLGCGGLMVVLGLLALALRRPCRRQRAGAGNVNADA